MRKVRIVVVDARTGASIICQNPVPLVPQRMMESFMRMAGASPQDMAEVPDTDVVIVSAGQIRSAATTLDLGKQGVTGDVVTNGKGEVIEAGQSKGLMVPGSRDKN